MLEFNIEVIEDYRMNSTVEIYTTYYIIVVDSVEVFEAKLEVLMEMDSFNPKAYYLVYYSTLERYYESRAFLILDMMWQRFINNVLLLIPKSLRKIVVYSMEFGMNAGRRCLDSTGLIMVNTCIKGEINPIKTYYASKIGHNFYKCVLNVVARKIDPFVISEDKGFEIELVKEIGNSLNATMNITLSGHESWGDKNENGSWSNGLDLVYGDSYLGVGNFFVIPKYDQDFDHAVPHFYSDLVWIVPIAQTVPKWRVLIAIFSWYLWFLCIAIIITSAIFFRVTCFSKKEFQSYKVLGYDFFVAFQVILTIAECFYSIMYSNQM